LLKIDRILVKDMADKKHDFDIVKAIIHMAHSLGLKATKP